MKNQIILYTLDHKERLDKFLKSHSFFINNSRNEIISLIKNQKVKINDFICTDKSFILKKQDKIELLIPHYIDINFISNDIKIDQKVQEIKIIYQNENYLIINKPKNLTVHAGAGTNNIKTLSDILKESGIILSNILGDSRSGIVHRLDKDTSGLMIIAKNNISHLKFSEMMKSRMITKKYLALCHGYPVPYSGKIENFITRDTKNIEKMKIVDNQNKNNAKIAITYYKTLKILFEGALSIVECTLETGRTHQLRLHLSSIKHPIVGDGIYDNSKFRYYKKNQDIDLSNIVQNTKSQMLHSYYLEFKDPFTDENMIFKNIPIFFEMNLK